MRYSILACLVLLSGMSLEAQPNLDSLFAVWQDKSRADSIRSEAYYGYIWNGFLFRNPDSAFTLAEQLTEFAKTESYPRAEARAYNLQGISFAIRGDYPNTLDYFHRTLKISEELGDKKGIAGSLGNIAGVYYEQSYYTKSLEYNLRCFSILEEIGTRSEIAKTLNNVGNIYTVQNNYPKAIEYYERSLSINKEIGNDGGIADGLSNIANIYTKQGKLPQALDLNLQSLKIREDLNNKNRIATSQNNIGNIHREQGEYIKALDYYRRALAINRELGNRKEIAASHLAIGQIYNATRNHKAALEECQKSLEISKEIGVLYLQKDAFAALYEAHKELGNDKEALIHFEQMQVLVDSLNVKDTNAKLQQMEFAKQMLADSLAAAEENRLVEEAHQREVRKKNRTRNIFIGSSLAFLLLGGAVYSRLRYVRKSKAALQVEKDRSENLLLNILPADIAEELKEKGHADARDFDEVSILFTDFKDFTETSEKLSAQELVAEINTCFEAFDKIVESYNIEKIKTIGDAYMAAGGLPVQKDSSAKSTTLAALEMQDFIAKRKKEMEAKGKPSFEMRVGIHTGPVVAGIVGVKKFAYDIWGDTVNIASRMESSGSVGTVNISNTTYELLKADPDLAFESRGDIEVKGKGSVKMHFVSLKQ